MKKTNIFEHYQTGFQANKLTSANTRIDSMIVMASLAAEVFNLDER